MTKSSRELKGYGSIRFLREFPTRVWTRRGLDNLLAKTNGTGSIDHVEGVVMEHATPSLSWNERRRPDYISPTLCPPNSLDLKGRVERIFFFASFKLPLFNEYEMVFIIA